MTVTLETEDIGSAPNVAHRCSRCKLAPAAACLESLSKPNLSDIHGQTSAFTHVKCRDNGIELVSLRLTVSPQEYPCLMQQFRTSRRSPDAANSKDCPYPGMSVPSHPPGLPLGVHLPTRCTIEQRRHRCYRAALWHCTAR